MLKRLEYLYHSIFTPQRRDYLDMGAGILARYERCKKYWQPHLRLTKDFQIDALSHFGKVGSLQLWGAGHLLDVPLDAIARNAKQVRLVDIDPIAIRRFNRNHSGLDVEYNLLDLTGSMDSWTSSLSEFLRTNTVDFKRLGSFLSELKLSAPTELSATDIVISLNVLGQLGVYWRDRVHALIKKHWRTKEALDGFLPESAAGGLESSCKTLERGHLELCHQYSKRGVILVTDTHYHYYHNAQSNWQTEPALTFEAPIEIPGMNCQKSSSWLWHIAPQGVERGGYGEIHEVWAGWFA